MVRIWLDLAPQTSPPSRLALRNSEGRSLVERLAPGPAAWLACAYLGFSLLGELPAEEEARMPGTWTLRAQPLPSAPIEFGNGQNDLAALLSSLSSDACKLLATIGRGRDGAKSEASARHDAAVASLSSHCELFKVALQTVSKACEDDDESLQGASCKASRLAAVSHFYSDASWLAVARHAAQQTGSNPLSNVCGTSGRPSAAPAAEVARARRAFEGAIGCLCDAATALSAAETGFAVQGALVALRLVVQSSPPDDEWPIELLAALVLATAWRICRSSASMQAVSVIRGSCGRREGEHNPPPIDHDSSDDDVDGNKEHSAVEHLSTDAFAACVAQIASASLARERGVPWLREASPLIALACADLSGAWLGAPPCVDDDASTLCTVPRLALVGTAVFAAVASRPDAASDRSEAATGVQYRALSAIIRHLSVLARALETSLPQYIEAWGGLPRAWQLTQVLCSCAAARGQSAMAAAVEQVSPRRVSDSPLSVPLSRLRAGLALLEPKVAYRDSAAARGSDVVKAVREFERQVEGAIADATAECLRATVGIACESASSLRSTVHPHSSAPATPSGMDAMLRCLYARVASAASVFVRPQCEHDSPIPEHLPAAMMTAIPQLRSTDAPSTPIPALPLRDAVDFGWNATLHALATGSQLNGPFSDAEASGGAFPCLGNTAMLEPGWCGIDCDAACSLVGAAAAVYARADMSLAAMTRSALATAARALLPRPGEWVVAEALPRPPRAPAHHRGVAELTVSAPLADPGSSHAPLSLSPDCTAALLLLRVSNRVALGSGCVLPPPFTISGLSRALQQSPLPRGSPEYLLAAALSASLRATASALATAAAAGGSESGLDLGPATDAVAPLAEGQLPIGLPIPLPSPPQLPACVALTLASARSCVGAVGNGDAAVQAAMWRGLGLAQAATPRIRLAVLARSAAVQLTEDGLPVHGAAALARAVAEFPLVATTWRAYEGCAMMHARTLDGIPRSPVKAAESAQAGETPVASRLAAPVGAAPVRPAGIAPGTTAPEAQSEPLTRVIRACLLSACGALGVTFPPFQVSAASAAAPVTAARPRNSPPGKAVAVATGTSSPAST